MPTKKSKKFEPKKTLVTRQFLLDLANTIYDSKNRRHLNLCTGTLQNGPDPKNPKRSMHCGLGELYYAMTGLEPNEMGVNEEDVVELAIKRCPLYIDPDVALAQVRTTIENLKGISPALKDDLLYQLAKLDKFRSLIDDIQNVNDSSIDGEVDDDDDRYYPAIFKARARRVASQLREAAKLLPK